MRVRRSRAILALGLILMLGLASLYLSYRLGIFAEPDRSILTDEPCAAPCWYGITPGVSDLEEVRQSLATNPHVDQASIREQQGTGDMVQVDWLERGLFSGLGLLSLRNDVVERIDLRMRYKITLGQVVEKYGPPEKVAAWYARAAGTAYYIRLYYPSKGLLFLVDTRPRASPLGDTDVITEDMVITDVLYFAPTSIEDLLLSDLIPIGNEKGPHMLERLQDWPGFGPITLSPFQII